MLTSPTRSKIGQNDARLKKNQAKGELKSKKKEKGADVVRKMYFSLLFFNFYD
jgi:U3 small nucleolar RNA-associated protein 24